MNKDRHEILADVLGLLQTMARDWEFTGGVTGETRLFADLGFESLDIVVLATVVQERYGQAFPFPKLFAAVGQRELRDITVNEWADFIHEHRQTGVSALEAGT